MRLDNSVWLIIFNLLNMVLLTINILGLIKMIHKYFYNNNLYILKNLKLYL